MMVRMLTCYQRLVHVVLVINIRYGDNGGNDDGGDDGNDGDGDCGEQVDLLSEAYTCCGEDDGNNVNDGDGGNAGFKGDYRW